MLRPPGGLPGSAAGLTCQQEGTDPAEFSVHCGQGLLGDTCQGGGATSSGERCQAFAPAVVSVCVFGCVCVHAGGPGARVCGRARLSELGNAFFFSRMEFLRALVEVSTVAWGGGWLCVCVCVCVRWGTAGIESAVMCSCHVVSRGYSETTHTHIYTLQAPKHQAGE